MRHTLLGLVVAVTALVATAGLNGWSADAAKTLVMFQADLDGDQASVPSSTASGAAAVTLDTETNVLAWSLSWAGFPSEVIAIHFHGPAEPGVDAIVRVELDVISGLASPSVGETTISEAQKAEILSELWYINIHTEDFGGGEIRGQVVHADVPPTPEPIPTPEPLLIGDVNCSGGIDSIDATLVLQLGAGLLSSLPCEENADVNRDHEIDSIDALNILFLVAGFVDALPIR